MSAFKDCPWCNGRSCNQCTIEQRKAAEQAEKAFGKPIFTARIDNPHDMQLLKQIMGREAIEKAFSPGGGGAEEIQTNAAIASLIQCLHNEHHPVESDK